MNMGLMIADTILDILGDDIEVDGFKTKGVMTRRVNKVFDRHVHNPKVTINISSEVKAKQGSILHYQKKVYEVVRIIEEEDGIQELELRCMKEQELEMILPTG